MKEITKAFKKDQVLLIKGPASVKVNKGRISCLGNAVSSKTVIRKGKVLPFECEDEECEVSALVIDESCIEIQGQKFGTYLWKDKLVGIIQKIGKEYKKIIIIGPTDSGKSTLSVYLLNLALERGLKAGIIDADLGQSDLSPPAFIGCKKLNRKIFDLRDEKAEFIIPIGVIDSLHFNDLIIEGVKKGIDYLKDSDVIIINTDGFVVDKGAENKIKLIKETNADLIIALNDDDSVNKIVEPFKERALILPRSRILRNRNVRAERRELQYQKYLVDARKVGFNLNDIRIGLLGKIYYHTKIENNMLLKYNSEGFSLRILNSDYNICIINSSEKATYLSTGTLRGMFVGLEENGYIKSFGIVDFLYDQRLRILTNVQGKVDTIWLTMVRITNEGEQKISYRFI